MKENNRKIPQCRWNDTTPRISRDSIVEEQSNDWLRDAHVSPLAAFCGVKLSRLDSLLYRATLGGNGNSLTLTRVALANLTKTLILWLRPRLEWSCPSVRIHWRKIICVWMRCDLRHLSNLTTFLSYNISRYSYLNSKMVYTTPWGTLSNIQ